MSKHVGRKVDASVGGARVQSELVCVITNSKVNKIRTEAINDYNRTLDRLEKLNDSLREQNLRPIRVY